MSSERNPEGSFFGPLLIIVLLPLTPLLCSCNRAGDPPGQPIAFNHKLHVSDHQIHCPYCHMYAARGPVAGVPTVKTCMGCHSVIATDKPEIEKLAGYWEEKRPVEWMKVYDLPDFVRFTHKRHVQGGVGCEECHGPVGEMVEIRKHVDMKMGWCLDCHSERGADIDCVVCHR